MPTWPHWARYRRTAGVGALTAGLVAATIAAAGPGDAAPAAEFSNGIAKATAILGRVAPGVGSLELAITNGVAVSEITNDLAQAQAQTLDFGLIGTSITAEQCDGDDPYISPDQLPQPTRVDNRGGDTKAETTDIPVAGQTFGGGIERVEATEQPLGRAVSILSSSVFGPVATLENGRADAVTEIIDDRAREARASVEADLDVAGVVQFHNLRWSARHRTGSDPDADAGFSIAGLSIADLPVAVDDLSAAEEAVNLALAPSGISVAFPKVERFEQPADLVRVTPLRIVLNDSPAGKLTVGTALNLTREQREKMFDDLAAVACDFASVLLVGDITLSVVGGTGFLAIEVGGAEATTAAVEFEDPFGGDGGLFPSTPGVPGTPGTPGVPRAAPTGQQGVATPTAPTASTGPVEERCESVHSFQWPPCSAGSAVPVGLLGLVATAAVGFLDWRHQRARASMPVEAPA